MGNEEKAKSVDGLGIFERYKFEETEFSRYGFCFKNKKEDDEFFEKGMRWEPLFLNKGEGVDIVTSKNLPWIFRFSRNRVKDFSSEPKKHSSGIKTLSKVVYNREGEGRELDYLNKNSIIDLKYREKESLVFEFDGKRQGKTKEFKKLNLIIKY